ncbi:unnamed protein product, partial [Nesidiocoris tenuis]
MFQSTAVCCIKSVPRGIRLKESGIAHLYSQLRSNNSIRPSANAMADLQQSWIRWNAVTRIAANYLQPLMIYDRPPQVIAFLGRAFCALGRVRGMLPLQHLPLSIEKWIQLREKK